jgi:N6-adenosine-specific RNA methylase IME4
MKYQTIVADPPWPYPEGFFSIGPSGRDHRILPGFRVDRQLPYCPLSIDAICALPISRLAETHCRLFLWTTNKFLPISLGLVLPAWGFDYRQLLIWHKADSGPLGGSVAPNTAEFLVVAVRGKPGVMSRMPGAVIKRGIGRYGHHHSDKPECFLDYIEQVSPGPYLELFARRNRLGWDTWGDESLEMVKL